MKKTNFSSYHLKSKYREVLDNLSDEDKIKTVFKKTSSAYIINNVLTYYELKDHSLVKEEANKKIKKIKMVEFAYLCAKDIIESRWPEAEIYFKGEAEYSYLYARDVIKNRWPEAEHYIAKDYLFSVLYAKNVIEGRWPEIESRIKKDSYSAYIYARYVLKERWPEAEPYINKDPFLDEYKHHFNLT
jgi:hypothetical protein